jgi:hypothetical protein
MVYFREERGRVLIGWGIGGGGGVPNKVIDEMGIGGNKVIKY